MKKLSLFLTLLIVPFFATDLAAQGLGIGPQVGYQKAQDAENGKALFGVGARLKLTRTLGVEGSINYRSENYLNESIIARSWPVQATGLIYPLPFLYGALGFGWYNTTFDYNDELNALGVNDNTVQDVGWHLGAGVELPFGQSTKLTGDIRYVFLNYEFNQLEDVAGSVDPRDEDLNSDFIMLTVGIYFGL